ncbi:MAG: L-seryl-tRNA(Sec) selenium transferase [Caldilinea sp.]|nr:L-seryl-tRNA(Sec) selenium transferase [Caldilinea sp.]MDW8442535.1 L-seryl-tRNA(Sec) selenium transferase [Caldilineaceae bacterium]
MTTMHASNLNRQAEYRKLPAVDALLRTPELALLAAEAGVEVVAEAARAALAEARHMIAEGGSAPSPGAWVHLVQRHVERLGAPSLRPVINATGVIIHTNLGRAPLSAAALEAVRSVSLGYSTLEYDLEAGARGSRHEHARRLLCELTGAEDAMVVNNNAAALYLILSALCTGREVLISRSQLVEIGGGFRIPDVLRQSGARLVEVGATNRTHLRDFVLAVTAESAAVLRVHSSNFRQIGFVTMPTLKELIDFAHSRGLVLIDDLGSGALLDTTQYGLAPEPMVQRSVAEGADLVAFSGDKLLGGPQAGVIVGRAKLIEQLRRHPLARALRVDKMTLAALEATLISYRRGRAVEELPVWRMIAAPPEALHARAESWRTQLLKQGVVAGLQHGASAVGGGSLPGETLPTTLLTIEPPDPDAAAACLRSQSTPVICRIQDDRLLFDPRTVLPEQEETLLTTLREVFKVG